MSATTYHTFEGKLYFPQITTTPDVYMDEKKWTTKFELGANSRKEYDKSRFRMKMQPLFKPDKVPEGADNPEVIRLTREFERDFRDGKGVRELGPPDIKIWDKDAKAYVDFNREILIGNGTRAKVTLEQFDTKKGTGHRLREVAILELVEYVPPVEEDDTEETEEAVTETTSELDDEVPF